MTSLSCFSVGRHLDLSSSLPLVPVWRHSPTWRQSITTLHPAARSYGVCIVIGTFCKEKVETDCKQLLVITLFILLNWLFSPCCWHCRRTTTCMSHSLDECTQLEWRQRRLAPSRCLRIRLYQSSILYYQLSTTVTLFISLTWEFVKTWPLYLSSLLFPTLREINSGYIQSIMYHLPKKLNCQTFKMLAVEGFKWCNQLGCIDWTDLFRLSAHCCPSW